MSKPRTPKSKPGPRRPGGPRPHKLRHEYPVSRQKPLRYEAVVAEGLEDIARRELSVHLGKRVTLHRMPATGGEPGVFRFDTVGGLRALLRMKTIQAIYLVRHYPVPRPRGLLGNEHLFQLLEDITLVRSAHPADAFHSFYISAAGEESAVLQRLREEIATETGLQPGDEEGDLLLRLRRPLSGLEGWEVLLRVSPRPFTTRPWRVCNMEGALNATIAHAMALMTDPQPYDVFLNLACGSGSILIERLAAAPARRAIGCDTSPEALACARQNAEAAGVAEQIELQAWDARQLPLESGSVDALSADLPFGHLLGSHDENVELYPAILAEAARVARPGALFSLITHEIKLTQALIAESTVWRPVAEQRVALGGLYPRLFVLQRQP